MYKNIKKPVSHYMFAKCSHFVNSYDSKKRYKCKEQKDAARKGGVKFLSDTTN